VSACGLRGGVDVSRRRRRDPGARAGLFSAAADAGPGAIAAGEATKDALFCGLPALRDCSDVSTLRAQEAPFYSAAADLSMYVLPGAGHSLELHRNAHEYRDATRSWLAGRRGLATHGYHSIG
jgi:hypothetical protein